MAFLSRSSVVGQSVKDWFRVHFGVNPSEDMFDTCTLFASKPNMININSVIATADSSNGTTSSRLGDLAGQAFASSQDSVSFDCNSFGFVFVFHLLFLLLVLVVVHNPNFIIPLILIFLFPILMDLVMR